MPRPTPSWRAFSFSRSDRGPLSPGAPPGPWAVEVEVPVSSEPLRLMAVHAHPDDESSKGAATMARYVDEGVRVRVVTCTGGERGDVLNPKLAHDTTILDDMPAYRRREMAAAAEALGIEHVWLGFIDSGLPEGDPPPPVPEG